MVKSGVYRILNLKNGKYYIGSSVNINARFRLHRSNLDLNKHENKHLQNSWNKHGKAYFRFDVLLYCSPRDLLFYEQRVLDVFYNYGNSNGYNICRIASNSLGTIRSNESKAKMRKAAKRRMENKETRDKISKSLIGNLPWNKGKKGCYSEETIKKISNSLKGNIPINKDTVHTNEIKDKMSKLAIMRMEDKNLRQKISNALIGYKHAEGAKENMREGQKKAWATNINRKRLRKHLKENPFFKGKTHTQETKEKISKANSGKSQTKAANEKRSLATKKQWIKFKENNPTGKLGG